MSLPLAVVTAHEIDARDVGSAPSAAVSNRPPDLSSPWLQVDIGSVASGQAIDNAGEVSVVSPGDATGAPEQLHFVYQAMSGDGEIVARVAALGSADPSAQAGVMIRGTLTASAMEIFAGATGDRGWIVRGRDESGSALAPVLGDANAHPPGWIRLVRNANQFSAYVSADGISWSLLSEQPIAMPNRVYIGFAVVSHTVGSAVGVFTDVSVKSRTSLVPERAAKNAGGENLKSGGPKASAGRTSDPPRTVDKRPVRQRRSSHGNPQTESPSTGAPVDPAPSNPSTSNPDPVTPSAPTLDAPWQQRDIGIVDPPGTAIPTADGIIVKSRARASSEGSAFHYVYQQLQGDVELIARVRSPNAGISGADAGVMVRETLEVAAAEVFAAARNDGWVAKYRETATSEPVTTPYSSADVPPGWVRIRRVGNLFSLYESADGVTWNEMMTRTIVMPDRVYVGLAVASNATAEAVVLFSDVSAKSLPKAGRPPTVLLMSPSDGSSFIATEGLTINAIADDPDGDLWGVVFSANGSVLDSDTTAPFSLTLDSLSPGTYTLSAIAIDGTGLRSDAANVSVTVLAPVTPPVTAPVTPTPVPSQIAIVSPAMGAIFSTPATVVVTATATSQTRIARIDFYGDNALIGSAASSPYTMNWNNVLAGSHSVFAVMVLDSGESIRSSTVSISVVTPSTAVTQSAAPATLVFTPSSDDPSVLYYSLEIYLAGDAVPAVRRDLGKPIAANQEIRVDIANVIASLAQGSYVAVVTAYGQEGSASSQPSPPFTK